MISDRKLASLLLLFILAASAISVSVLHPPDHAQNSDSGNSASSSQAALIQNFPQSYPNLLTVQDTQYPVYLNETGLPTGTLWSVNISGLTYSSTNSSIRMFLSTGMYHYSVTNSLDYFSTSSEGIISVHPGNNGITLNYGGILSPTDFLDLYNLSILHSSARMPTNQSVFPVYGTYDSYSNSILVVGYSSSRLYDVNSDNLSQVSVFNAPENPVAVSFNPHNGNIFVINSTTISAYNSSGTLLFSKYLGAYLISIAYFPSSNQIAVGNLHGTIEFLNVSTLNAEHTLSGISFFSAQMFAYNNKLGLLEAINDSGTNGMVEFIGSNDQVLYSVSATGEVISILYDPQNSATYYTSYNGNSSSLYVIDSAGNNPISCTNNTYGLGLDPYLNAVFATNTLNSTMIVVNATSNIAVYTVRDSGMPVMAVNLPGKPTMVVINPLNDALDIISLSDAAYRISFMGNHLEKNTKWTVVLNSFSMSSTGDRIDFYELTGNYTYSVLSVPGYQSAEGGTISVGTSDISVPVNFSKTYQVSFVESGLPANTNWRVDVNGTTAYSDSSDTASLQLANGTYSFFIHGSDGFTASPQSGYMTVNGSSLNIPVQFSNMAYNISFDSSGLPSGTTWTMTVNGILEKTDGSSLNYSAIPGTYDYSVSPVADYYPASNASGSVSMTDSAISVSIMWLPYLYPVTFTESALPSGTQWYVNLSDGTHLSSAGHNMVDYLPVGQYNYTFGSVNSSWHGSSGSFSITGSSEVLNLIFTPVTYKVIFRESGLPYGTGWNVAVSHHDVLNTTSNETSIFLQNGTYSFTANAFNSSYRSIDGNLTVTGRQLIVPVDFSLLNYTVMFVEEGLPQGTTWGIYISGTGTFTSSTGTLNISLQVGTYSFTPLPVKGYSSSYGGYFTLSDRNITIPLNYSHTYSSQKSYNIVVYEMGLPEGLFWAVDFNGSYQVSYPGGAFNITAPNGTYNLEIGSVNHDGKIMPGSMNATLQVQGSNQTVITVFYGSYVWLMIDFTISGFNNGHGDHDQHTHDGGNQSSDFYAADARRNYW